MKYIIDFENKKKKLSYNAWLMYHQDEVCKYIQFIVDRLEEQELYDIFNCCNDDEIFENISKIIYTYSHKDRPILISK
tara:strand:- start:229 stop:462 length:234 start_codon:yes stop_codon:yes gene_type:complete